MSKVLNIDDMLEVALDTNLPGSAVMVRRFEKLATGLQKRIAKHLKVTANPLGATWEGKAFAGLCASFTPAAPDQTCPEVLDEADPGGDW